MAATATGDYTLQQNNIAGFAEAFFLEKMGLYNCGLIQTSAEAQFNITDIGIGNTWQIRGDIRDITALQTPTANQSLTINKTDTYVVTGVVARRAQVYGVEDIAKLAAGDSTAELRNARKLDHNVRYGVSKILHESLFPALFHAGGCLNGTHLIDTSGATFEPVRVQQSLRIWGEHGTGADGILMHSYVRSKLYEQGLILPGDPELVRELETQGVRYGGTMSGMEVFLDDMCYSSNSGGAGVYNSYVFKRGAVLLGYDGQLFDVEIGRDGLLAGGTNWIKGMASFSPHVWGTTTSLSPTVGGGATDAEIATVGSWAKRTGVLAPEIGIVCIQSTEV